MRLQRLAALLAALWAGVLAAVGFVAVPVLFQALARQDAGRLAGAMFDRTAYVALVLGVVVLLIVRHLNRRSGVRGPNAALMWTLATLFFLVAGHFGLQPMVVTARDGGSTPLSFNALHAISTVLYVLQMLSAAVLSWCLTGWQPRRSFL